MSFKKLQFQKPISALVTCICNRLKQYIPAIEDQHGSIPVKLHQNSPRV